MLLTTTTEFLYKKYGIDKTIEMIAEAGFDAIDFSINNKKILGDDRELAALAVAGVFALPQKYFDSIGEDEKSEITKKLLENMNKKRENLFLFFLVNV